jgi:TP901 family phage tail tape measure protein
VKKDIRIRITVDSQTAAGALGSLGSGLSTVNDQARLAAEGFGILSRAASSVFSASLNAFLGFERGITEFGAITGATAEQIAALSDEATRLGVVTSKSPAEVAALAAEFGRLGLGADATTEALEGIVRASEASGTSLSSTGQIIGAVLNQFELQATETLNVADILVFAANNAATSVEGLGSALSLVGGSANAAGQDLTTTAAALGLIANAGIDGTRAGTALAGVFRNLSSDSPKVTAGLKALNVEVFDGQGNFRNLADIVRDFEDSLDGLTQEERIQSLAKVFDVESARAFNALITEGADAFDEFIDATDRAGGTAEQTSQQLLDTLGGSFTLLSGSLETLAVQFGAFFAGPLKVAVDGILSLTNAFLQAPPIIQNAAFAVGSLALVFGTLAVGIPVVSASVTALSAAFVAGSAAIGTATTATLAFAAANGPLIAVAAALGVALAAVASSYNAVQSASEGARQAQSELTRITDELSESLERAETAARRQGEGLDTITGQLAKQREGLNAFDRAISAVRGTIGLQTTEQVKLNNAIVETTDVLVQSTTQSSRYADALFQLKNTQELTAEQAQEALRETQSYTKAIDDQIAALRRLETPTADLAESTAREIEFLERLKSEFQDTAAVLSGEYVEGIEISIGSLEDLGSAIEQLTRRASEAQTALASATTTEAAETAAKDLINLTNQQLELGELTRDQALERLEIIGNDTRLGYEVQIQALNRIRGIQAEVNREALDQQRGIQQAQREAEQAEKAAIEEAARLRREETQTRLNEADAVAIRERAAIDERVNAERLLVESQQSRIASIDQELGSLTLATNLEVERSNQIQQTLGFAREELATRISATETLIAATENERERAELTRSLAALRAEELNNLRESQREEQRILDLQQRAARQQLDLEKQKAQAANDLAFIQNGILELEKEKEIVQTRGQIRQLEIKAAADGLTASEQAQLATLQAQLGILDQQLARTRELGRLTGELANGIDQEFQTRSEILGIQQEQQRAEQIRNQLSAEQGAILATISAEGKTQLQLTSEIAAKLGISNLEARALAASMTTVASQTERAANAAEREADAAERTSQARSSTAQQFLLLSASAQQLEGIFAKTLGTQQEQSNELTRQIQLVAQQAGDAERAANIINQNLQNAVSANQTVTAQIGRLRERARILREGADTLKLELDRLKEARRIQEDLIPPLERKVALNQENLGILGLENELLTAQVTKIDRQIEQARERGASESEINRLQSQRAAILEEQESLQREIQQLKREEQILDLQLLILQERQADGDDRRIKNLKQQIILLRRISEIESSSDDSTVRIGLPGSGRGISLPGFADGGIVDRPTLAMIGEGGEREYVIPQSKMQTLTSGIQSGDPSTIRALQSTGIQLGGSQMMSPQVSVSGMSDSNIVAGLDDVKNLLRASLMMGSNGGQTQGIPNRQNRLREFVLMGS